MKNFDNKKILTSAESEALSEDVGVVGADEIDVDGGIEVETEVADEVDGGIGVDPEVDEAAAGATTDEARGIFVDDD
uniref:Uncharacterized protein n=1 Tax=Panagrolaimus sp. ES5 TaxID=591445 RepID=A0AC34GHM2_9BILA